MEVLTWHQLTGLGIFGSYFALIFALFCIILWSLPSLRQAEVSKGRAYSFIALTAISFAHTWFYMFTFMRWSFVDFETSQVIDPSSSLMARMATWLSNTALFEQAWAIVCSGPQNWWWSEQLCLFTVGAWTAFLLIEARHRSIKCVWAYMLLGQVVAISVASNLFYLAVIASPVQPSSKRPAPYTVPFVLWTSVILSLGTVFLIPHSLEHDYFLLNLLAMHALLVIPLVAPRSLLSSRFLRMRVGTLYTLLAIVTLVPRARTITSMLNSIPFDADRGPLEHYLGVARALWETLHSHPAQSSIGYDVIWTTISFFMWVSGVPELKDMFLPLVFGTVALSIGLTAPVALWGTVS